MVWTAREDGICDNIREGSTGWYCNFQIFI